MTDGQNELRAIARSLYELPPSRFTAARNEAASEASKNPALRALAPSLKRLPKASPTAWAVTALARDDAEFFDSLLDLGRRQREAQSALDPVEMRSLGADRQRLVADASSRARELAVREGVVLSGSALIEVGQTLQAAMTDEDAAAAVRGGLLVRGLTVSGWEPVALAGAEALPADGAPESASRTTGRARSRRANASEAATEAAARERKQAEDLAWQAVDDVGVARARVAEVDETLAGLAERRTELEAERAEIEEQLRGVEADLAEVYRDTQLANREKKSAERDHLRATRRAKQAQEKLDQHG